VDSVTNTTVWRWDSDAFGKTAANDDPDGDGTKFTLNLRFPGQYYDSESGLHYNYHRYYDPNTGRYITSDPIGLDGGLNTYGYVGGNPVKYFDKYGLFRPCELVGGCTVTGSTNNSNYVSTPDTPTTIVILNGSNNMNNCPSGLNWYTTNTIGPNQFGNTTDEGFTRTCDLECPNGDKMKGLEVPNRIQYDSAEQYKQIMDRIFAQECLWDPNSMARQVCPKKKIGSILLGLCVCGNSNLMANELVSLNELIDFADNIALVDIYKYKNTECGQEWFAKVIKAYKGIENGQEVNIGHLSIYSKIGGRYVVFLRKNQLTYDEKLKDAALSEVYDNKCIKKIKIYHLKPYGIGVFQTYPTGYKQVEYGKPTYIVLVPKQIKLPDSLSAPNELEEIRQQYKFDEKVNLIEETRFDKFMEQVNSTDSEATLIK